jgi:DNA-binding NtrC family response regulator
VARAIASGTPQGRPHDRRDEKNLFPKEKVVKEKLESLVTEMIDRRIYLDEALNEFEKKFIQSALTKTGGNQTKAAKVLGVHRNTLNRKVIQHKLNGH